MKQIPWIWIDQRTDLPKWLREGIGNIAVEWSALESEMEECIRQFSNTDVKTGRILTTGMSARSRRATILNLVQAHVWNETIPSALLSEWTKKRKLLDDLEEQRNKYVHGIWGLLEGKWYLLRGSGTRVVTEALPEIKTLARAVMPQREQVTVATISKTASQIASARRDVAAWRKRVVTALPPSLHKSIEQIRQTYPLRARRNKAAVRQHRSSRP